MNRQHRQALSRQSGRVRIRPAPAAAATIEPLDRRLLLSAGDGDPTFAPVEADFPALAQETARRAARQSDGRVVVLVTETDPGTRSLLARYTAAGKLDTTFGAGGSVLLPFTVGDFALRADDKVVVAGYAADNSDPNNLVLARYTAGGQIDTTFGGGDGRVEQPLFGNGGQQIARLLIRPDNRMVIAGQIFQDAEWNMAVEGFTAAGGVDTSFGNAGVITTDVGRDTISDAVLTVDGKVVVVGNADFSDSHHPFNRMDFEVARYTPAGQPDPTFGGGDGVLTTSFGNFPHNAPFSEPPYDSFDRADAVAVDPTTGAITVAGSSYDPTDGDPTFLAMARYKANGDLDPTFSPGGLEGSGKLWTYFGLRGQTHDLALLPGGKILVSGTVGGYDGSDFGLARLNADGSFDTTFGVAGQVQANPGGDDVCHDLLVQPDERAILVGGALDAGDPSPTPPGGSVVLARFFVASRSPFAAAPAALPGTLQFEDYDRGGEGVALHDFEPANLGGAYRTGPPDAADIQAIPPAAGGGYTLAFTRSSEFTEYTVNVTQDAAYDVSVRVASLKGGGFFNLIFDGVISTGVTRVPATGDWQKFTTLKLGPVGLTPGRHILGLALDLNDSTGYVGNFDSVQFTRSSTGTPFNDNPFIPDQQIQAEEYDRGGEGVAYHDADPQNIGAAYRTGEGVDLQPAADTGGGFNVGFATAGEWLQYTVASPAAEDILAGINVRVASLRGGGRFHFELDGSVVARFTAPNTGGWQTYATLSSPKDIRLTHGIHRLRLVMDQNDATGYVANFNWLRLADWT